MTTHAQQVRQYLVEARGRGKTPLAGHHVFQRISARDAAEARARHVADRKERKYRRGAQMSVCTWAHE